MFFIQWFWVARYCNLPYDSVEIWYKGLKGSLSKKKRGQQIVEKVPHFLWDEVTSNLKELEDGEWLFKMGIRAGFAGKKSDILFR